MKLLACPWRASMKVPRSPQRSTRSLHLWSCAKPGIQYQKTQENCHQKQDMSLLRIGFWGGPNVHSSPIFLECQLLFAVYVFFWFCCWKLNQKFECAPKGTSPLHHSHQPVVRTIMIHLPKHCHMHVFYAAVYVTGANANKIEITEARRLAPHTVLAHI